MRDELARVLTYPQIVPRLAFYRLSTDDVLASFDRHARLLEVTLKARLNCSDRHVLSMSKRLLAHGVRAQAAI